MGAELLLLAGELLLYGVGMLIVFHARRRIGLGVFLTAIGSLHFLETYLAANLYVQVAPGFVLSPGSVVMFSGKFLFILLLYIREDATVARQPILGLLIGNLLAALLVTLLARHVNVPAASGAPSDLHLFDQMGLLMIWGSILLFIDCLLVILAYERISRRSTWPIELRLGLAATSVLVFDQLGFFAMLHFVYDVPMSAGYGGMLGKVVAAFAYAALLGQYLRRFDVGTTQAGEAIDKPLGMLFGTLTYRQRYEALRQEARRDALTRLFNRGEFDRLARHLLDGLAHRDVAFHLLLIDIDHFKSINDLHGHPAGDRVLRDVAAALARNAGTTKRAFRFGGDEFAMIVLGMTHEEACAFAEHLRRELNGVGIGDSGMTVGASIGVASAIDGAPDGGIDEIVRIADGMLYRAKADGRNRVAGERIPAREPR